MATTFKLERMNDDHAVVSFALRGEPRKRFTVSFSNPGLPGAIRAICEDGTAATLGSFRIDGETPHPDYMRLRRRVETIIAKRREREN